MIETPKEIVELLHNIFSSIAYMQLTDSPLVTDNGTLPTWTYSAFDLSMTTTSLPAIYATNLAGKLNAAINTYPLLAEIISIHIHKEPQPFLASWVYYPNCVVSFSIDPQAIKNFYHYTEVEFSNAHAAALAAWKHSLSTTFTKASIAKLPKTEIEVLYTQGNSTLVFSKRNERLTQIIISIFTKQEWDDLYNNVISLYGPKNEKRLQSGFSRR